MAKSHFSKCLMTNTVHTQYCLQSVINIQSGQLGPRESPVIILSAESLHRAPLT